MIFKRMLTVLLGVTVLNGFADEAAIQATVLESMPVGEAVAQAQKQLTQVYSAFASTPDGVVQIGGLVDGAVSDRVLLGDEELPAFPHPVAGAGAAVLEGQLFVVGGFQGLEKKEASREIWSLDLADVSKGWKKHEDCPGAGRIFPTVAVLNGELHVFGGKRGGEVLGDAWGYRLTPVDGTTRVGWRELEKLPVPLAAAASWQTGQTHVALLGGEPASDQIQIYDTVTDTWVPGGPLPVPVGAAVVAVQDELVVLVRREGLPMQLTLNRTVKSLSMVDYGVMLFYFCLMAGIGVFFARKQNSSDEFALGSRNVKWWAAGISMFATGASSISFMAIPALAYRTNLFNFTPVLFVIGTYFLQAYVLFPLLRRLQLTSTYEYLERRYNPALRFLASLQCILFQVLGRMSVVLLLPALAISAVTGMSVSMSVLVMGLLTTIYTSIGGFEAVIWTDVCQGVLMIFGALLMVVLAISGLPGGWSEFVSTGQQFHKFDMAILSSDYTLPVLWGYALLILVQQITIVADQTTIQRVFASPMKDVRKVAGMNVFAGLTIAAVVNVAGIAIFTYFRAHPDLLDPGMSNDQVVPLYIVQRLPVGIAGLIIAALFAASMSTLSSSMNSVATLIAEDFYRRLSKKSTDRSRLLLMKRGSIVIGVFGTGVAYVMAQMEIESMFQVWNEIIALIGGGFVGIYMLGMFTRRTGSVGAVVGALGSVVCLLLVKTYTDVHWVFYTAVATGSCMLLGYLTSFVFPSSRAKEDAGLTVFG